MEESKEEEMEESCLCINAVFIQEPFPKLKVFFFIKQWKLYEDNISKSRTNVETTI